MEEPKKPKSLIPKRAQVPLVIIGVVGLLYVAWDTANTMGWIGGPPRAKKVVAAKQPVQSPGGTTATQPTNTSTPAVPRTRGPSKDLDSIRAPARDPMTDLGAAATPPPPQPGTPASPTAPSHEPPPLPPPMPTPGGAQPGFPSPVTGPGAVPPAVPGGPRPAVSPPHPLPAALAAGYPLARRGTRAQAIVPNVTLMGTISGSNGALAVVHPGESARGQYVKPGQPLAGGAARVESIKTGKIKVSGQGGSRELSLRPRREAAPPKPETPAAGESKPPKVEGAPDTGPAPE